MEVAALYAGSVDGWARLVEQVEASQWGRATPCTEWTVRDLVNHVVGEDLWTVPLVEGSTIEEVGARFDGDVLGEQPVARARTAATEAVAAVTQRLPEGGTVQLSYGEEQLEEYVRQLAADHLVHGWDLAVAIGADPTLDPELVDEVAGWFGERADLYRQAGLLAEAQQGGDDAQSRLIAAFGRNPGWTADSGH